MKKIVDVYRGWACTMWGYEPTGMLRTWIIPKLSSTLLSWKCMRMGIDWREATVVRAPLPNIFKITFTSTGLVLFRPKIHELQCSVWRVFHVAQVTRRHFSCMRARLWLLNRTTTRPWSFHALFPLRMLRLSCISKSPGTIWLSRPVHILIGTLRLVLVSIWNRWMILLGIINVSFLVAMMRKMSFSFRQFQVKRRSLQLNKNLA